VKPPSHLSPGARREWQRVLPLLDLAEIDAAALAAYCQAFDRWAAAERGIAKFGAVVVDAAGLPVKSPFCTVAAEALAAMRSFMVELGLTPRSRARREPAGRAPVAGKKEARAAAARAAARGRYATPPPPARLAVDNTGG
jgi:P27 family predicted phage terminase small subunit